jgi:3-hydroxybutyryl-CoA dehydratase
MAPSGNLDIGAEVPSVTKLITQEQIDLFEACGIMGEPNIHTDPALAARRLGTNYPIASGRMSVTYASESLRKFFGADAFHRTGNINLKFLRPVKPGDSVTVTGHVTDTHPEEGGTRVVVQITCQNQNGDATAAGVGTALV